MYIASTAAEAWWQALAGVVGESSPLEQLFLDGNGIGDEGAKAAGKAARSHPACSNYRGQAMARALVSNNKLILLRLDENNIGDAGVQAVPVELTGFIVVRNCNV